MARLIKPPEPDEDVLTWAQHQLVNHYAENPNHGPGCGCSDEITRVLRIAIKVHRTKPWLHEEPEHIQKAYRTLSGSLYRLWQDN